MKQVKVRGNSPHFTFAMLITPEKILDAIRAQRKKLVSFKFLVHALDLRSEQRKHLRVTLDAMVRRGQLEKRRGQRYTLASETSRAAAKMESRTRETDFKLGHARVLPGRETPAAGEKRLVTGRLIAHREGYGFVVVSATEQLLSAAARMERDIFIPPRRMHDAMHGDRVLVEILKRNEEGRAEGQIVKVLERAHVTVVGQLKIDPTSSRRFPEYIVVPYEERLQQIIRVDPRSALMASPGSIVDVEITEFPRRGQAARGRVVEVLGLAGDFGIDVEVVIRKFHLPHRFPPEVGEEAKSIAQEVSSSEIARREDFRRLPIVTIDGETAKDFDDAVYVQRLPNGHYELQVHIADVAHYVRPDSPLDLEARLRGTSVYFPDRAVPMLPVELSNGICSLNPHVDRLVQSCIMEIDRQGTVVNYRLAQGVIRSLERMTYTNVAKILVDKDPATIQRYQKLVPVFQLMEELAQVLNRMRDRRGSIDFDLPEPILTFDENGMMTGVVRSERNVAHRLIEEFMLIANETVARHLERAGQATLFRIHETPDAQKVAEFEMLARSFGYSLGVEIAKKEISIKDRSARLKRAPTPARGRPSRASQRFQFFTYEVVGEISPFHYQRLTEQLAGKSEERILSYLMLRSLKQARYSEKNVGHFGLASKCYTHFTSPIRRYPDLIVHRILKALTAGESETPEQAKPAHRQTEPSKKKTPALHRGSETLNQRLLKEKSGGLPADPRALFEEIRGQEVNKKTVFENGESIEKSARLEAARAHLKVSSVAAFPRRVLYDETTLALIAAESSEAERLADEAERELIEWKKAKFMANKLGEEFDAILIGLNKNGFFVELLELFIEGFVPVSTLIDDFYVYREPIQSWVGERTKKTYRLGDHLRVLVDKVDVDLHRISFAVVEKRAG